MDEAALRSAPVGPSFLDVRSMANEYAGLQRRVINASAEIKQLYDRNTNLVNEILQLKSEHSLNGKIKVPYIPREMNNACIPRIPKRFHIDENGNKVFIEPSVMVRYGPNEEIPFRNPTAFDGYSTMNNEVFLEYGKKILEAQTREEARQAIDELNRAVPGPSLGQLRKLCSSIKGSFGKEARCYVACLCGVRQASQEMGAVQPDLSNPTSLEENTNQRPEEVYSLIDSLPSMEEREIVRAALCGTPLEARNAISKSLNALILGGNEGECGERAEDIEGPNVCAEEEEDKDKEGNEDEAININVGEEKQEGETGRVINGNANIESNGKNNGENDDDEEEAFGINVEDDMALN